MPLIESSYQSPWWLRYKHFATIYPTIFRKISSPNYIRERIITPDQDFFDVDYLRKKGQSSVVLILHGLEGSSSSKYAMGVAKYVFQKGYDACLINHRGCSGELNNIPGSYHSGFTTDLDQTISILAKQYEQIHLVGFSLGGNIVLKYAGEQGTSLHPKIGKVIAVSVPCDLAGSAIALRKRSNWIYMRRFLGTLIPKSITKIEREPVEGIDVEKIRSSKDFFDFDEFYTAPAHGFNGAEDYWSKSSSRQFIPRIAQTTFLINALNDPFLTESCFPFKEAKANPNFHLETPKHGGHVGFKGIGKGKYWIEDRIFWILENGPTKKQE